MKITIKDVAKAARVSPTLVSHALNGRGRVAEATVRHVQKVAKELGYTPDPRAIQLRSGLNPLIAVQFGFYDTRMIMPSHLIYNDIVNAASIVANDKGHPLVILPALIPLRALEQLALNYAICLDLQGDEPIFELLHGSSSIIVSNFPHATLKSRRGKARTGIVDVEPPGTLVLDHLENQGFRNIAIVTGAPPMPYERSIVQAARRWSKERDLTLSVLSSSPREFSWLDAVTAPGSRLDAIYLTAELDAGELLARLKAQRISVPQDIGIVLAADSPVASYLSPTLTAVHLDGNDLGQRAAALLFQLESSPAQTWIDAPPSPVSLVPRESTNRALREAGRPRHPRRQRP